MLLNPWKKAREATEKVSALSEKIESLSVANARLERINKSLVDDRKDLDRQLGEVEAKSKTQIAVHKEAIDLLGIQLRSIEADLAEVKKILQETQAKLASTTDANKVLSDLASHRLEKINKAKEAIETFTPSQATLRSNKALRMELDSAVAAIKSTRTVLCLDQDQS